MAECDASHGTHRRHDRRVAVSEHEQHEQDAQQRRSHLAEVLANIPPNAPARDLGLLLEGVTSGTPMRIVAEEDLPHSIAHPDHVPDNWRELADARARSYGAEDGDIAAADAFETQLNEHDAWGLCFFGWSNAAGYGYTDDHDFRTIAEDGWDSYAHFAELPAGAQTVLAVRALMGDTDADRVSAWHFLKHDRNITWDVDYR